VPRQKKQHNARQKLRQSCEPQVERPVRDFVDLPADATDCISVQNTMQKRAI